MHAHEVYPYDMHACDMHAHKTHAYEMHARETHAYEMNAYCEGGRVVEDNINNDSQL